MTHITNHEVIESCLTYRLCGNVCQQEKPTAGCRGCLVLAAIEHTGWLAAERISARNDRIMSKKGDAEQDG